MWKNPVATAVLGGLLGFFGGYLVGQGRPAPRPANPHSGVPGAPALNGQPQQPPEGGRTAATANPRLMEDARQLDALLAKDPNNYEHLVQMGNLQYDMTDYAKAIDYYEKARTIRDGSADVMTDLGVCYKETGNPKKALELFEKASDMQKDHWQSLYNAAVVRLFDLNDPVGAKADLDRLKALKVATDEQVVKSLPGLEQEIAKRMK
jgi:tetratricopeptide (TPR) repeat protein